MSREIDPAIGRWVVMQLTDDGLSRIQGRKTLASKNDAVREAEIVLRSGVLRRVTIVQIGPTYQLDPKPKMLSNEPELE